MAIELKKLLPLLQCPRTGTSVRLVQNRLISDGGEQYPIVNGKPILVRHIQEFHITRPASAFISRNTTDYKPPSHLTSDALCLHLGSGDVPSQDARVISMDILPTDNTDIVAEAEALPFKDDCLDYVASGAVFEHVLDPIASAREVRRVLKEGGEMFIDTAFLQGYHGFPSHYFNMTPQAVETFICDDFILEDSYVPQGAMVTHALVTQFDRFLELLPDKDKRYLQCMSLLEALNVLRQSNFRDSGLTESISEFGHRALAASFAIRAKKPEGYTKRQDVSGSSQQDRIAYYAARVGVIQRHHEIILYRRLATEKGKTPPVYEVPNLQDILRTYKITQPQGRDAFKIATNGLRQWDENLSAMRDEAISIYL
jgi:SAM-dependent methyltransferase